MTSSSFPTPAQISSVEAQGLRLARAYEDFVFPEDAPAIEGIEREYAPFGEFAEANVKSIDWRELVNFGLAKQQETCNACTAFAVASAIEINRSIAVPGEVVEVSAGYLHTCVGHLGDNDMGQICLEGIDLFRMLRAVRQAGYAWGSPGDYPFDVSNCALLPVAGRLSEAIGVAGGNDAKRRLLDGPIVADMYVWPDFFSYTTGRGPEYVPDPTSGTRYLHSVCVIGFDDAGWIVRNSYGPDWGDGTGCATIPYSACGLLGAPPPEGGVDRQAYALVL